MADWIMVASQPTPPGGSEQWASLVIPGNPADLAYGFRVRVPDDMPQSWNTLGFFGLFGVIGGRYIMLPTRTLVAIGRGEPQALSLITVNDAQFPATAIDSFGIGYFVHHWVDATTAELWALR